MKIIYHRINSLELLKNLPTYAGLEFDVRYHENDLIVTHDPFGHHLSSSLKLNDFLPLIDKSALLIVNLKTEGIEEKCAAELKRHSLKNWFFLDISMPYFVKLAISKNNEFNSNNLCVRFSDYESLEYAKRFAGLADWIWIDIFEEFPLNETTYREIIKCGFKICLVSPELQGHSLSLINDIKIKISGMTIDAVCTKRPDLWK